MSDSYPTLEKLERKQYPAYGVCIYCGAKEHLTAEHIIPFGLGGTITLPQASCENCAKETSRVERIILRGEFWPVRIFRAFRSRRKHQKAPKSYPLVVLRNGIEETVQLPLEKYPILVPFPEFSPPRIGIGNPSKTGIDVAGIATISFGPDPETVLRELKATSIKPHVSTHPAQFARMLAKIAYATAAAEGALSLLADDSPIRGIILGTDECIGDYVGTLTYPLQEHKHQLHRVAILQDSNSGHLVADVQLFSDCPTPRYAVLLGKLASSVS